VPEASRDRINSRKSPGKNQAMTDEPRPDAPATPEAEQPTPPADVAPSETAGETATAVATPEKEGEPSGKLHQNVDIRDLGACKKHIKVTVERADIDERFKDHFKKLVHDANVPGFRPGKAPRKLIERRFRKDVAEQVKTEVLMASLQQLGDDHDIAPLSQPNLDPAEIELPEEGPLVYEFEVETRPQFDSPPIGG
jgi:trigger factor